MMSIEDFSILTSPQIVEAYNNGQLKLGRNDLDFAKIFRDHKTGVERLSKIHKELVNMHGYARLFVRDDKSLIWSTIKPEEPIIRKFPKTDHKIGATTLSLQSQLVLLIPSNPKRVGTIAHVIYEMYSSLPSEATGEDFVKIMVSEGYSRKLAMSTLHWDIDHDYIKLEKKDDV